MADSHDTHNQGGGFWGCANILIAAGFAGFAGLAGALLIYGGLRPKEVKHEAAPAAENLTTTAPASEAPAGAVTVSGDTVSVTIKPGITNPMSYDVTTIHAKSGQKIKITYINQHPTTPLQHNLLLCKPGSRDRMIAAANNMMADLPGWMAKGFIPESPDVLHHTKLINPGDTEVLEFTAGEKGDYPYLCTFPGHSIIMQGTLKVE